VASIFDLDPKHTGYRDNETTIYRGTKKKPLATVPEKYANISLGSAVTS